MAKDREWSFSLLRGALFDRRFHRLAMLVVALGILIKWQAGFGAAEAKLETPYKVTASTGINREADFVFFLYHLNLFPIATDAPIRADTADEARRQLAEEPTQLKQDWGSTFRSGDRGRTYLYLLDCWLHKKAISVRAGPTSAASTPMLTPANGLAFVTALSALLIAFWAVGRMAQGCVLCVLLGSNPYQLFAVYGQQNVFSYAITAMILALAINIPVMMKFSRRPPWYPLAAAIGTGLILSIIRTVRSEPTPLLLSVALMYATIEGLGRIAKVKLVLALVLTFALGSWGSLRYLDHKLVQSKAVVAKVGGSPYAGPIVAYHEFWHALFCGLGDFDKKHGYAWDDLVAYRYAYPILKERHPDLPIVPRGAVQAWNYDAAGKYPFLYSESPGYHEIIRDKILSDIKSDPLWYLDILKQRAWRTLTETTPVGIAFKDEQHHLSGPILGLACIPLALFLLASRRWFHLKLLVFSVPLSVAPMFIYSGKGMTCYTMFHYFGFFIFLLLAADGCRLWLRSRHSKRGMLAAP